MNESRWERWGAASGIAVVVLGAAAMVFERAPVTAADFAANRTALRTQSMLFLAGAAVTVWFLGSLRSFLIRSEGGTGRLSTVVFGAGIAWTTLNMMAQAFQLGVASDAEAQAPTALIETMSAVFTVANLPLAVMLVAVAVVSLRHRAFPGWLGWIAVTAAVAQLLLWLATVADSGPLASDGWLSFVLYPFFLVWLVPATAIMMKRAGKAGAGIAAMHRGLSEGHRQPAAT
ncbi:MAG TPA: hypothetical protein VFY84_01095 [Jiangellales bacterium]|nr:hypothetical protein [Jiangellales bacterium]